MLYLLFGEDEFACAEALGELVKRCASDPAVGDLNRSELDGSKTSLAELRHHCDSVPFLADRRLVIVEGLVARVDGRKRSGKGANDDSDGPPDDPGGTPLLESLLAYLPTLPESTDLVLYDPGLGSRGSRGRVVRWARSQSGQVEVREFSRKNASELQRWIRERVKAAGGTIDGRAAAQLTWVMGDDTRALANEIEKLALFAGPDRAVTSEDIRRLVPHSKEANIFAIIDAISERKWTHAVAELRQILDEGAHPLYILTMIHRQFSLIVSAKALAGERLSSKELGRRMGVHEYPAKKAMGLAGRYTAAQLVDVYDRLLDTDLAIKTGKMEGPLALELFITGLQEI